MNPLARDPGGGYARAGTPAARYYTGREDTAYLNVGLSRAASSRTRARTLLHEMCHRLEDAVPGLIEHEREHHRVRLPGAWDTDTGDPLLDRNHERNAPEGNPPFFHPYLKTRYTPQTDAVEGYEILSMSVERPILWPSKRHHRRYCRRPHYRTLSTKPAAWLPLALKALANKPSLTSPR